MAAVGCEGVPIRAEATERAGHVVAPEGALVTHLTTFVHVLTNLSQAEHIDRSQVRRKRAEPKLK